MLECPACKASYKEEVNICKRCNLSEDNIPPINLISPDNPIFNCIAFLVERLKKFEKSNYQQSLSELVKQVKILTNQQKENNQKQEKSEQKIEELEKRVFELESQRQSDDNHQNTNIQTESETFINSQSANSREDNSNNYDSQDVFNTKENNRNDDNIVASQNENLIDNNYNDLSNLQENISSNEPDKNNIFEITEYQFSQFVEIYNRDKNLFEERAISTVIETQESVENRLAGFSNTIFLSDTSKGRYWIVEENNQYFLVPHAKIKINEHNQYTIENLFEYNQSNSGNYNFQLIQPAKVSRINSQLWKLEKKGKLEFY